MLQIIKPAVILFSLFFADHLHAQGTKIFRGRLIGYSNISVKRISVRIIDQNSGVTNDDGSFEIPIGDKLKEVSLAIGNGRIEIKSPVNGKVNIPADPNAVTDFYIGESETQKIIDKVARGNNIIIDSLKRLGVKQDDINQILKTYLDSMQKMTNLKISDFRGQIALEQERRVFYPGFSAEVVNYINEAKDVKDAFKFASNNAFDDTLALKVLNEAIARYNPVFQKMNNDRRGYEKIVSDLWTGTDRDSEVRELFNFALGDIHSESIFILNQKATDINDYNRGKYHGLSKKTFRASLTREIEFLILQLERRLNDLDSRAQIILSKLAN